MVVSLPQLEGRNVLTHSRMQTKLTCDRKHYFAYELGWRPAGTSKAIQIGQWVHHALDWWCHGAKQEDIVADLPGEIDGSEHDAQMVAALVRGYFDRYALDEHETIASELPFRFRLRNPRGRASRTFDLAGKIDRIVRLPDDRLAVLETKTMSESVAPESDYWTRLELDNQISLYMIAARELGYDVETVIYDAIRKPSMKPTTIPDLDNAGQKVVVDKGLNRVFKKNGEPRLSARKDLGEFLLERDESPEEYGVRLAQNIAERPEFYYARREIPRLEDDLDQFMAEVWQLSKRVMSDRRLGITIRNTGACDWKGRCPYLGICRNAAIPGQVPEGYRQLGNIHPELEEADAGTKTVEAQGH
ncbi:MAG: PD-(D/E)XK nuclease family protein [Planctomycetota bacterium]